VLERDPDGLPLDWFLSVVVTQHVRMITVVIGGQLGVRLKGAISVSDVCLRTMLGRHSSCSTQHLGKLMK
jgi:hypothetical protein